MRVINLYGREMDALYFGNIDRFFGHISDTYGEEELRRLRSGRATRLKLTITYYPSINEYMGNKSIQLMIQNYRLNIE